MSLAEVSALSKQRPLQSRFVDASSRPTDQLPRKQPVSRAVQRRGQSSDIHLEIHDVQRDRTALEQLAIWCECFSPIVGVENNESPQSLLLDITGLGRLFGSEEQLAGKVCRAFHQRGYQVRVAIADTVGTAWAVARYGEVQATEGGKSNEEGAPPIIIPPGKCPEALGPLPIECLRIPDDTVHLLQQLGVECVDQLLALPRAGLSSRFGATLIDRVDQALGEKCEVIVAHRPPPEFETCWSLEHPTDRRSELEVMLTHLVGHLSQLLSAQDHGAVQVECRFDCVGRRPVRMQVGLFQPTSNPQHLNDLLRMQLETVKLSKPVNGMHLRALTTVRVSGKQHELWDDPFQAATRELAALIDRLSSRLGQDHVLRIQPQADALPERAYREIPLTSAWHDRRSSSRQPSKPPSFTPLQRPLWLQDPPLPLQMVSVAADGPPIFFHYQNHKHDIVRHWGPERIETAWWRGRCVRRDYYRVETSTGSRFWLFRRLMDGQWFLHGCFE